MSTPAKKEVLWINTLKGGCILLVVLHHTIITTFAPSLHYLTAGIAPAEWWVAFNKYLSPLRMPAFFFVSGLLACSSIVKKSWQEVFTKKFSNIVYLYLLWGVIQWLSIHYIATHLGEKPVAVDSSGRATGRGVGGKALAVAVAPWFASKD